MALIPQHWVVMLEKAINTHSDVKNKAQIGSNGTT